MNSISSWRWRTERQWKALHKSQCQESHSSKAEESKCKQLRNHCNYRSLDRTESKELLMKMIIVDSVKSWVEKTTATYLIKLGKWQFLSSPPSQLQCQNRQLCFILNKPTSMALYTPGPINSHTTHLVWFTQCTTISCTVYVCLRPREHTQTAKMSQNHGLTWWTVIVSTNWELIVYVYIPLRYEPCTITCFVVFTILLTINHTLTPHTIRE